MATGNRALIGVLAAVMLVAIVAAFALDWSRRPGAAAYMGLASAALGVLCPSPFRFARPGGAAGGGGAGEGVSDGAGSG